jgi:hypothetical protein
MGKLDLSAIENESDKASYARMPSLFSNPALRLIGRVAQGGFPP